VNDRAPLTTQTSAIRTLKAGLAYFGWTFGAGFLLGTIRVPFLVPRLGERTAELLEMPLMLAVIWLASADVIRRFELPHQPAVRIGAGLIALALLVAAELLLTLLLSARPLGETIAARDPVSGTAYLLMLLLFALMPLLQRRRA
jgi:hypothetical protein